MTFTKYNQEGAYHRNKTIDSSIRDYNPRLESRYLLAIKYLDEMVNIKGSRGLDIGCGEGVLLELLSQMNSDPIGIDSTREGLQLYEEMGTVSVPVVQGNGYNLPFDTKFDFASMIEVIEHLKQPVDMLEEVESTLRPGGVIILTTPKKHPNGSLHDDIFHEQEFTPEELRSTLETVFTSVDVYGFYPKWLDQLYAEDSGIRPLDLFIRGVFKYGSKVGVNPYVLFGAEAPKPTQDHLLAVGVKADNVSKK